MNSTGEREREEKMGRGEEETISLSGTIRRCTKFRMNLLSDGLFETSVESLIYRVSIHYSPSRRCKIFDRYFETSVDNLFVPLIYIYFTCFGKVKFKNLISQHIIIYLFGIFILLVLFELVWDITWSVWNIFHRSDFSLSHIGRVSHFTFSFFPMLCACAIERFHRTI